MSKPEGKIMRPPCLGCIERHINCHASCERYKEFTLQNSERLERRREEINTEIAYMEHVTKKKDRKRRRHSK